MVQFQKFLFSLKPFFCAYPVYTCACGEVVCIVFWKLYSGSQIEVPVFYVSFVFMKP
jgi:hypothetical protein